jgi:hypothetical protein
LAFALANASLVKLAFRGHETNVFIADWVPGKAKAFNREGRKGCAKHAKKIWL